MDDVGLIIALCTIGIEITIIVATNQICKAIRDLK